MRERRNNRTKTTQATAFSSGEEYRSKKASGDVKKDGQLDPYAYIRLDSRMLNKRNKAGAKKQFKGVLAGSAKSSRIKGGGRSQSRKQKGRQR